MSKKNRKYNLPQLLLKRLYILTFILFGSLFSSGQLFAHVEKIYFLKGKVGEREIAVKMLFYDELPQRYVSYFFQDDKTDRKLKGFFEDDYWSFRPEKTDTLALQVNLKIVENTKGNWLGTWTDEHHKTVEVILNPMENDSFPSKFNSLSFVKELDPYEAYKLSNIDFKIIKSDKKTKNLQCDWVLNEESGIKFFRIKLYDSPSKTDSINAILKTINLSLIQKYFSYHPDVTNQTTETDFLYVSNELISFKLASKTEFKDQKSLQNRQFITLDLNSAKEIDLESIIWLDKTVSAPSPDNLEQIYKYRNTVFAPQIFKMLQQLYPQKMETNFCDINKVEAWALPVWALTNKGLALSFLNNAKCDVFNWAVIPYKKLTPYINKKYHLKAIE